MKKIVVKNIFKIDLDGDQMSHRVDFSERGEAVVHNSPLTSIRDFKIKGDARYPVFNETLWKIKVINTSSTKKGGMNGLWIAKPVKYVDSENIYNLFIVTGENRQTSMTSRTWILSSIEGGEIIHHYQVKNWKHYWVIAVKEGEKALIKFNYRRKTGRGNRYQNQAILELN